MILLAALLLSAAPPNVVVVFADDLGYGDLGCYGAKGYATPNIDRLAKEGIRFTDFYVPQAVCSASRAALLTGCYPNRIGILGALGPTSRHGIHADETTLAEVFKSRGYATAAVGKWHLGDKPKFHPQEHGFDQWFGLPYSNDMWPFHPTNKADYPPLPLFDNERIIARNPDQTKLTTQYAERAVQFIEKSKDRPFFLYVAHSMPHVPLFVSEKFKGKTERGLFGDVISEIDWSVGEILASLSRNGLDSNTLVIFTSDNGPWLSYGDHAGSAGPLREGKGTQWEGGVRVPCVMRWPERIPKGAVCKEPAMTIDLLPTLAKFIGAEPPKSKIDGLDVGKLLLHEPGAKSPHEALYFYWGRELQAVRSGKWKLHFPHEYTTLDGKPGGSNGKPMRYAKKKCGLELYDLEADVGEKVDLSAKHPEEVTRIKKLADAMRAELGESSTKTDGNGMRQPGKA
jgi:arylsulfatase A